MPVADGLYWEAHGLETAPALILSSGLGGAAGYWQPNLAALAARYRVIVYDQRGTGRSERMIAKPLSVAAMADDVLRLLDALDLPRATLVGHALGGHIGLALALAAPERLARLVVVNGWAALDPHSARCFDTRLHLLRDSGARAYLHAQPLFLYPPCWISAHGDALAAEEAAQLAHFPGAEMVERRIAAVRAFDVADRLGEIALPTLVVVSDDDMLVPPSASERLARGLANADLRRVPGGHACTVTNADSFNAALIDWLDGGQGA